MTTKGSVTIIGVGNMGGAMATNLLSRGYGVYVHDIDSVKSHFYKEKGAFPDVDIDKFAINSVVSIICVVDAQQTEEVLFGVQGLAYSAPAGHTIMLCPTIAPQDVERISIKLTKHGLHTIDAPMSGGPARAAEGSMSLMVACAEEVYERHAVLLNDLSSKVFHISQRPGDGARTKLVNNLLAAINLVGAAEALVLAERLGLDLQTTLNVIEQSSGQSWIGSDRMRRAINGRIDDASSPLAHISLLAKDTALALNAARQVELTGHSDYSGPLGVDASRVFAQAMAAGLADEDDSMLLRWLQTTPTRN
jgi:L-threonate 2-dehydrogenase